LFLAPLAVTLTVTTYAESDQVVHHIVTKPAPGFHVMDHQAFQGTALFAGDDNMAQAAFALG